MPAQRDDRSVLEASRFQRIGKPRVRRGDTAFVAMRTHRMERVPRPDGEHDEERCGEHDAKHLGLATGIVSSLDDAQHP